MARLTGKDYRDILKLVYLANRCEDVESFVETLCPIIMQAFRAESTTFHLIKGYPKQIKIVESRSFKSDGRNLYEDKYYPLIYKDSFYKYSPLLARAVASPKIVLKIGDSVSFQDWERLEFYNDFMRPQHLYRELFLTLRWKSKLEGMITLWRSKKQPDYEDGEVLKAARLASHLGVVIHNLCLISQVSHQAGLPSPADEAYGKGVLWLDHEFRPFFFNTKARDICTQLFGGMPYKRFDLEKGTFPVPSYIIKDCLSLLELVKAAKQPTPWPKERVIITESGKRCRIEYSLIWKADITNSKPNFLVTLSDLNDEKNLGATLQAKFHLSRRELDVIYYLIRGLSDGEIGEKLYISRQTVHTHTKNIYRKLGTRSRIELYRKVIQGELTMNIQAPARLARFTLQDPP